MFLNVTDLIQEKPKFKFPAKMIGKILQKNLLIVIQFWKVQPKEDKKQNICLWLSGFEINIWEKWSILIHFCSPIELLYTVIALWLQTTTKYLGAT